MRMVPRPAVAAAAANPNGRQHASVARLVSAATIGVTFSTCFIDPAHTFRSGKRLDGRTLWLSCGREGPVTCRQMPVQRPPKLSQLLDPGVDVLDAAGQQIANLHAG